MLAYAFVILAVLIRLMPHPWHFTPVAAALLFFGARMPRRQMWVPLALLFGSDVLLNSLNAYPLLDVQSWASLAFYAVAIVLGGTLRDTRNLARVGLTSIAASTVFFLTSNFMVWAAYTMYPHTLSGLATCYWMAIPFFRNTFVGDFVWSLAMFGLPMAIAAFQRRKAVAVAH
ncbi:MAG: hypothetical protein HYX26_01880 [Acidobacteriales bacterium]|nr:hypothetical protein [Terriglobales bacterium]